MDSLSNLWLLVALFFGLNIGVTAARSSLAQTKLPYLMNLREQRPFAVERTIKLLDQPRLATALRLATLWAHFTLAALVVLMALKMSAFQISLFQLILILLLTGLLLQALEMATERIVSSGTERWALRLTWFARLLYFLLSPFAWLVMAPLGQPQAVQRSLNAVTEDELKEWVEVGQPEGSLEQDEREMIASIFEFSDTLCREIMVPRMDVVALDVNTSVIEAARTAIRSGHSRLPVFESEIDNVIGLLFAKDLLRVKFDDDDQPSIRSLLRKAYFVPEAKKVDELLREMQRQGTHMAVVVDEYGGMAGLVTLEDIVEEIVGEIRDEYDEREELLYQQTGTEEYIFQGRIDLDDFNEVVGTHLTKDVADTLGGFLYGAIGRVPAGGEQVRVENWLLTVEQVSGRRIRKVRAVQSPLETQTEEQEDEFER